MGFPTLNNDLYTKECTYNERCACGHDMEDAKHVFLQCNNYANPWQQMFTKIYNINVNPTLALILKGSNNLNINSSTLQFTHLNTMICHTSDVYYYSLSTLL